MKTINQARLKIFYFTHLPPPTDQFHAHSDNALVVGTNTGVAKLTKSLPDPNPKKKKKHADT
jgi:hypothetical protein